MGLLKNEDKEYLKREFENALKNDVRLILFSSEDEHCIYCKETRQLLEEVSALSDKILLEVHDIKSEDAKTMGVEHTPTIVITDSDSRLGSRIKFIGIPSGYEFTTLIKDIMFISSGELEVSPETREALKDVNSKLLIEVYVTPSCPYCPKAVLVAHQFAMISENIEGVMIESLEFPSLADRWSVMGVPHTVIRNLDKGNVVQFVGAYPETHVINFVKDADEGKDVDMR
ncbi:protein disulfide oxidoreductase [Geoglobus acetivorans]|uniref:Glutaredoxin-like protein n=1 Tax=Geoglobus acetivorans TaxID=565033 RepID=A0A0A7GGM6_GEOAI|nr:glutaredoxin-like protein [Geoglobus acetivorans]